MIVRLWRGWTAPEKAEEFESHVRRQLPIIESKSGYRGLTLLRMNEPDAVQFLTITSFDTMDDIRAFAGESYTQAVIPPALQAILVGVCESVEHYDVVLRNEPGSGSDLMS